MLSDVLFVQQTIFSGALYLRMLRQFCLNLELGFYVNNQELIQTAKVLRLKCEEIGRLLIDHSDKKLPEKVFGNYFLVTEYTLSTEKLTEKLFDIKLAIDTTEKALNIQPGVSESIDEKTTAIMMQVNTMALALTRNFIEFCKEIYSKMINQELFSFVYPSLINYMIETATLYENQLLRIISKTLDDPSFATDYEYWFNTAMKDSATFVRGLVNPKNDDIYTRANSFVNQFDYLLDEYRQLELSPENQRLLTEKSLNTVKRYKAVLQDAIKELLDRKAYFIIEPTFLDNLYAEANYFQYMLEKHLEEN